MISLTEDFIQSAAPNADAVKKWPSLVLKKKFTKLHKSDDDSILFAYCQGSGKDPYLCSADFAVPEKPVYRCSCPSRQFPCKHSIGLLFAYLTGQKFTVEVIPESIASKREKVKERVERKRPTRKSRVKSTSRRSPKRSKPNWMALTCWKS